MFARIGFSPLALLLFTAACVEPSGETATETDSSAGSTTDDSTGGTTPAMPGTTGDGPTTGEVPTTGDGPTTDASTAGDDTGGVTTTDDDTGVMTGDDTGAPVDPDAAAICQTYCDQFVECGAEPESGEECRINCIETFTDADAKCQAALKDTFACIEKLSCDQVIGVGEELTACFEASGADEVCIADDCVSNVFEEAGACGQSTQCGEEPAKQIVCDEQTCTCLVNDESVGECPAEGVCMDLDALAEKSEACCGF